MSEIPTLMFEGAADSPTSFNVVLYGPTGSGKSAAAATAPGPIIWLNTQGGGAIKYARKIARERGTEVYELKINRRTPYLKGLLKQVMEFIVDPGDFEPPRTIVVDMLADLRAFLIRQVVVPGAKNSIQQFGEVADLLMDFVLWLRDRDINCIIICHPEVEVAEGERTVRPLIGGAITERIPSEADIVGYTTVFRDEDDTISYVAQLVEGRGRVAKNRGGALGAVRPLDLSEWLNAYIKALTPEPAPFEEGFDELPSVAEARVEHEAAKHARNVPEPVAHE